MQLNARSRGWIAGLVLVGVASSLMAPTAEAGHGSRRYKGGHDGAGRHGGRHVRWASAPPARVIEVRRSSSDVSTLIGFIGGVALGAALSHASHQPEYVYEDPCGGQRFASFDLCATHVRTQHHPRVVRVIETRTGRCVHTYQYDRGDWRDRDPGDYQRDDGRDDVRYEQQSYPEDDTE